MASAEVLAEALRELPPEAGILDGQIRCERPATAEELLLYGLELGKALGKLGWGEALDAVQAMDRWRRRGSAICCDQFSPEEIEAACERAAKRLEERRVEAEARAAAREEMAAAALKRAKAKDAADAKAALELAAAEKRELPPAVRAELERIANG